MTRTCLLCHIEKPLTAENYQPYFSTGSNKILNRTRCRQCIGEKQRETRANDKKELKVIVEPTVSKASGTLLIKGVMNVAL
jgi:hypothetical protein